MNERASQPKKVQEVERVRNHFEQVCFGPVVLAIGILVDIKRLGKPVDNPPVPKSAVSC